MLMFETCVIGNHGAATRRFAGLGGVVAWGARLGAALRWLWDGASLVGPRQRQNSLPPQILCGGTDLHTTDFLWW